MFEGWLSDLLALYLGQVLDVQKDQLRFSLWSAWQTGITLENVALRQDAFDHFNLPFRLRHGRIGRLTAQIPWKSLSSPLLVELEDVELWVEVVDDREDVPLETVMQRLWKRKKTLIASEELEDLAKETGSQTKGGSFFFSFLRRAAAVFLKRLQFTVRSVHVSVVDDSPTVYRRFGFTLESFGTQPGAGGSPENGMQDVHKSAALEGLQLYWTNHSHSKSESPTPIDVKQGDYLLRRPLNVDIDIRLVLEQRKGRMLSMWANVSLGFLDIALQDWQIVDMYKFSDALQWKTVRSKYLDVLQTSTCSTGPSRNWRSLWQFAINAVLLDLHGPLKAAPWRPRLQKQLDCLRYTAIYRNKLRGEDVSLSSVTAYDEKLTELERLLSIADIVQSRRLARQSVGQSRKVSGTPESGKSNAAIQEGRGGLIQGLAKAARVLGFSTSWVTGQSSEVRVAAPTESEVQELYSSVNAAYSTYEEDGDAGNGNEQGDQQEKGMDWTSGQLAAEDYAEDDGVDNGGINLDFGAKKASLTLLDGFKSTVARINAFDVQIEAKFVGNAERVVELMIDQVEGLDATSMPFIKCGSLLTELPAIRLQHAVVGWPVVLDILVQPVTAKMSLPLIQKLSAWMPPPMERSYDVVRMESINSLSLVAKLNIKSGILKDRAHQVRPIDLVAKIMSSEVRLVEDRINNEDGSYISLSIDEVIVHSVGLEESAQTMIKVESIVRHQEGQEGHQDQLAAMEAIEQELFYDHFHFKALNVAVYCCDMRSKNSHHVEVMSPVRLSGLIKVHAVPEDHSSSQMDISLDVGCVDVGLNDAFWEIMGNVQAFQQTNDVGIVINNCQDDNFMQQHSKLVKTLTLNVQLSSIEIKEMLTPTGTNACFTDQVRATGATVAVSIYAKGKPSVDADLKDLEILQHLDHKVADGDGDGDGDGDELLMKKVYYGKRRLLGMLPPFVKKITVAQARYTNYLHDFSRDRTEVCLSDILLEGDTLHQGCFLGRVDEHQPSEIYLLLDSYDKPSDANKGHQKNVNEISISLSNLAVGHSLLLYAANSSSNNDGGNAVDVNRIVVDVQNCRLAIKFQPSIFGQLETERPLEGSLFDFLKLHEDIARLDVGRVMLSTFPNEFPFSSESLEIEAEGIELVTATLGLVGCTTLPTLLLPFVSVTSNHACAPSAGQGSLSIIVPSIDFGIHPSHMVMADLVLQLYQHEMQPTPPTDHSSFDSLPFGVHLECSALGISILGTTLSSRCLKIEAKGLETTFGVAPVLDGGALRLTDAKLYLLNPSDPQNQIDVFDFGLSEMKNIHAGESAAPYALSRYLSVADSGSEWFEDAASDSMLTAQEGNWLSPTAKFSNKFPTSIVPLVVKSDRLWEEGTFTQGLVPTLLLSLAPLHLDGSWDAGEGGIEAQCQSFGMQIFLAPWQEAVDCFQMYTMFLNGTRYPRDKRTGEERNRMRPDVTASPLSISLRNVSIEVVDHATVARLVARLEVSVRETSEKDSGRVTRVDVAKALLSVGSRADSRAQVDDPHIMPFLGLEGLFARTDAQSLSVSLRHVSCWATPTSVEGIAQLFETVSTSFDAAFQGIRELKAGSHPAGPKEAHSEVSTSIQAPFSPFYSHSTPTSAPWENVVTVDLGCVAVLLALDAQQAQSCMWVCDSDSALLVEAVLQDIAFQATGTSCDHGIVAGTASFRLLVDTYDALCRGWEPLVEPCNMGVGFSGLSGSLGRKVSLDIPEGLEITVTRGGVEAVGRMIDVYGPGKDINHDRMKTQGARDVEDVIFNATHNTVEVTLFLDDHAPVHRVKVPPHTQIPLPSRLEDLCLGRQAGVGSRHCGGGRYVGRPDRTSPCGGIVWGNDTQESGMCSLELRGESPHWSCFIPLKPLEGLSRFPYKAKGTTDTNGPVIVDVESTTTNSLIITVRGDVCVRNTTPLELEVGWSDGGSIHPLDLVLGEGCSSLWLPPSAQAIALRVHKSTGPWVPAISLSFFPLPPCDLVLQGVDDDEEVVHLVVTRSQEQVVTVSSPLIIHSAIPLPSEIWASMPNGGVHAGRILHTRVMPNQKLPVTLFPRLFLKENLKKLCLKLSITPEGYSPCIVTLEDLPRNPLRVCIGSSNERHQKVDVNVSVDHDDVTGNGWIIHISCGFWAFNRLGIPVAVRQSQVQTPTAGAVTEVSPIEVIEVTSGWIQPLSENFNDAAPPKPSPSVQGLGQFLNQFQPPHPPASKSLRAHACKAYPGMLNATMSPLWLQLRTTQSRAPPGRTFWCEPFQVSGHKDHPKDKTVASLLSVPIVNARATPPSLGSYPVLVTVGPVPGAGNGVMGITFSPQYILHNAMDVPILYRQHGNTRSRGKVILPGARCPVTWEDASLPHPRLCFRVEESGWLWSGGVSLASVGDQLVKIRHRDQHRMTMLVRIDIGEEITIQTHRFAPYRIENCSLETLHFRQKSVQEYRDELRPYCSLPYAWDEPGERHLLVVESFGGHFASTFDLDRVGEVVVFGRRHLLIGTVRAEGPLRVLTIVDPALHQVDHGLAPFQSLPPFLPGRKRLTSRIRHRVGVSAGISHGGSPAWSFVLRLTSLGVSLVGNPEKTAKASEKTHRREVARLSLIDVNAQCEAYAVRVKAVLVVGRVQLDTPARDAAFPVALVLPAPFSLTSPLSHIKNAPFKPSILTTPAVSLALSVWTRRPAEVLCIQRAELIVPSVALYLDQKQMEAISNAISSVFPWNPGKHFSVSRATNLPTSQTSLAREKMYLEALQISPVNFTLSFSAFSRFLALADVEDARLRLAGLTLVDRLLSIPTFASVVRQHYMYALLPELFKLLGAVSVIGDPVALVQHLGMGVWSFLSAPAVGLVRSARHRILGHFWVACVNGTRALLVNVAYAVSNAATKAARATRKVVIAWGLGGLNGESIQSVQEIGLPAATARGIVGLLAEPIRGIETRGLGGLLGGIRRGALGAVALPLASALEMAAKTADGVRRRVMELGDLEGQLTWLRPARAMGNGGESILPLRPFDWTESMGRWLLDDVHAGEGETDMGEEYVLCVRCDVETNYLLLTTRRLLYILAHGSRWKADVLWQCALEDVELVRCLGKPDANQASLRVAAHPPRNIPGHLMMFSFLCVTCEQMDAQGMVAMITKSVEQRRLTCLRFVI